MKKIIAGLLLTIVGMIAGLSCDANAATMSAFQIDFIDVGQGDAVQVISTGIRHRASCSDSLQRES